jgi:TolB-like protein
VPVVLLATSPLQAAEKTALAVLSLQDKGAGKELVLNLTDVVTGALSELGVFQVLSRADIQQMVEFEQSKQLLGCDSDTSCLAELGGALGVALLVNGSVGKVGNTYIVNLTLTDASAAKVLAREQRQVQSEAELTSELQSLAKRGRSSPRSPRAAPTSSSTARSSG